MFIQEIYDVNNLNTRGNVISHVPVELTRFGFQIRVDATMHFLPFLCVYTPYLDQSRIDILIVIHTETVNQISAVPSLRICRA